MLTEQEKTAFKEGLGRFVPDGSVDPIFEFMDRYNVKLHITNHRKTKLGDYRWPQPPNHNYHEISVNGDLHKYYFLLVLVHEMAHLMTHQHHGTNVQPHGREWQEEYRQLLLEYRQFFPNDMAVTLDKYTRRLPLNTVIGNELERQAKAHDPRHVPTGTSTLNELNPGDMFTSTVKPGIRFRALAKRRTRWLCLDIDTNMKYLVNGITEVTKI